MSRPAVPNTPADSQRVSVLREDLRLALGSHPLRDDGTCPICEKRESAAHYCWPREAARDRLRKAGLDTPADSHSTLLGREISGTDQCFPKPADSQEDKT